ncbi:hypothetical protein M406DRAFT_287785 [Cryphonectria parasitica EP155]|uniref:ATPase synthesis protein 25 n=1 Tax=Cryphonectria parasitica (strain ATCC 38755 / EP155) TaxID=660469 RepID=A0A9P4Y5D1_CRYP1|nr:uncharacterized protein M406DRAFT_287785 [Cryphonectria parasitica EP155]KAF3766838.1 hypothetical protein M406DRAFT_287785 [Cryphonectria parasitica EP155]
MALQPALRASAAGCSACRTSLLRLFTLPHGPAIRRASQLSPPSRLSSLLLPRAVSTGHSRLYSTEQPSRTDSTETGASQEPTGSGEEEEPWYLQEEPPRHPTLVPQTQPLPKIPEGTPAILGDLVKCVAEDMGLDDLNLMDLRTLDPPAALGPSLIMLFGTARSERHLHFSAGRLKSWLWDRGIQAHADGLLGRREFKVKMRRRQRKAKLLGTSETALSPDDGVTTRWVCMNLGTIGATPMDETAFQTADGKLTGFGVRQTGTTIVVQMLTESKRRELDLETLWSRILARRGVTTMVEDDLEYIDSETHPNETSMFSEGSSPKTMATPGQRRFFSTTSCRRLSPPTHSPDQVTHPPHLRPAANDVDTLLDPLKFLSAKTAELEQLQAELSSLPHAEAIEALGLRGTAQPLLALRRWNNALRYLPAEQSWQFRLWMTVARRRLGVEEGDTLDSLRALVQELELLGIICQRDHYLELLQAVYLEPNNSKVPLSEQSELALTILNVMFARGQPVLTTDVVTTLIEALARAPSSQDHQQQRELQSVLEKFMLQADLPYMGEAAVVRLLDAYAAQDNWDRWWEVWRMPPKHLMPRSEALYIHLWKTMATGNHQRRCREAIRSCFFEMLNEKPPVQPTGAVKEALEACIRVADPTAEEIARNLVVSDARTGDIAQHEFVHMLRVLNPQWASGSSRAPSLD